MIKTTAIILIAVIAALTANNTVAGRLYKWTDEQGNIHYSDSLPPDQLQQKHNELSDTGAHLRSVDRAKTPEERARENARKQAIKEAEEKQLKLSAIKAEKQKQFDRMLLDTYLTESDIIRTRDRKIATIEGTISLTNKSVETVKQTLDELRQDLEYTEKNSTQYAQTVEKIEDTQQQLTSFKRFVDNKLQEQKRILEEFDGYLKRFREIKPARY